MIKQSGVNIDLGNLSSEIAYNYAIKTFKNRNGQLGEIGSNATGSFSNLLLFGDQRIGIGSDGIGTKAELAERTKIYHTLGFDLVAMVADDLVAMGFEPTNLSNVIDVDYLDPIIIEDLMKGLHDACNFSGISITGGEIAELGNRIGGFGDAMHFNWSSTAIGVLPTILPNCIDGTQIKPNQVVISLKSRGFRSNGFSSVRRIMAATYGNDWHNVTYDDSATWGEVLLTPSLIYAPFIIDLIKNGIKITGIAHITGGGIIENLRRVLKRNNVGAVLHNLFEPLPFMKKVQELGKISNEDAYLWWNMGNGMLFITDEKNIEPILTKAKQQNYDCQVAGKITTEKEIKIAHANFEISKKY